MCYYTCQGRTIRDRNMVLLDTTHTHFSVRALMVGLSRATHGRWLHIGDEQSEALYAGERAVRQRMRQACMLHCQKKCEQSNSVYLRRACAAQHE